MLLALSVKSCALSVHIHVVQNGCQFNVLVHYSQAYSTQLLQCLDDGSPSCACALRHSCSSTMVIVVVAFECHFLEHKFVYLYIGPMILKDVKIVS